MRYILVVMTLLTLVQRGASVKARTLRHDNNIFTRAAEEPSDDKDSKKSAGKDKKKRKDPTEPPSVAPSLFPSTFAPSLSASPSTMPPSCGNGMECDDPAPKVDDPDGPANGVLSLFDPPDSFIDPPDGSTTAFSGTKETTAGERAPLKSIVEGEIGTTEVPILSNPASNTFQKQTQEGASVASSRAAWSYAATTLVALVTSLGMQ